MSLDPDLIVDNVQKAVNDYHNHAKNVPLALCVSPIVARTLKEKAKDLTGRPCAPKLCDLPLFEFEELPPDKIIITTQEFALQMLKNRIPYLEAKRHGE